MIVLPHVQYHQLSIVQHFLYSLENLFLSQSLPIPSSIVVIAWPHCPTSILPSLLLATASASHALPATICLVENFLSSFEGGGCDQSSFLERYLCVPIGRANDRSNESSGSVQSVSRSDRRTDTLQRKTESAPESPESPETPENTHIPPDFDYGWHPDTKPNEHT